MALPSIMRKLFRNDGYGPLLKPEIIPFAASLASDAPDAAASTEWVKDLVDTPIYMAPESGGGNDANDGLTSGTPVRSFARALEVYNSIPSHHMSLYLSAGTYTDSFDFHKLDCVLTLDGNVTISGNFIVKDQSRLSVQGSYSLTVSGYFGVLYQSESIISESVTFLSVSGRFVVSRQSLFISYCVSSFEASNLSSYVFGVSDGSKIEFSKNVTITGHNIIGDNIISIINSSSALFRGNLNIYADGCDKSALTVSRYASLYCYNSLILNGSNAGSYQGVIIRESSFVFVGVNLIINPVASDVAVNLSQLCNLLVFGALQITNKLGSYSFLMDDCCNAFLHSASISYLTDSDVFAIDCNNNSFLRVEEGIAIDTNGRTIKGFIKFAWNTAGYFSNTNNANINLNGNVSYCGIFCQLNSSMSIAATPTGSVNTNKPSCIVNWGGMITMAGQGRVLKGGTPSVDATTFALYN